MHIWCKDGNPEMAMETDRTTHSTANPPPGTPGPSDSAILVMDSILTLLQLLRSEASQAARSVPALVQFNLLRLPVYMLAWLSFCVLIACGAHALLDNLLLGVAAFFLLQVAVILVLERRLQVLKARMTFAESRKGLATLQAGMRERLQNEELH